MLNGPTEGEVLVDKWPGDSSVLIRPAPHHMKVIIHLISNKYIFGKIFFEFNFNFQLLNFNLIKVKMNVLLSLHWKYFAKKGTFPLKWRT